MCNEDEDYDIRKSHYHDYLKSMMALPQNIQEEKIYINYQSSEILVFFSDIYFLNSLNLPFS